MKVNLIGLDIGGTKCAVSYGVNDGGQLSVVDKLKFETTDVEQTIDNILHSIELVIKRNLLNSNNISAIGISCGGPLDSEKGVVQSPPNLPGWDNIPIVDIVQRKTNVRCCLHNDANASALAEWKFGAGRGTKNMAYLTCSTGLGAGLVINGALYTGANDNAGELGHIRLADFGPVGYGKMGSFEGFSSGNGIAQLAGSLLKERFQMGQKVSWCQPNELETLNAHKVAMAAAAGDSIALEVYRISAAYLGRGLSVIIDILNPELIVIGGIYTRNKDMMEPWVMEQIEKEALHNARRACKVVASELGEQIGDFASLSVAYNLIDK